MISIQLAGRLGNQLFQWATAKSFQEKFPDLCLTYDSYHKNAPEPLIRDLSEGNLDIRKKVSTGLILRATDKFNFNNHITKKYLHTELNPYSALQHIDSRVKIVRGYFQNWEKIWEHREFLAAELLKHTDEIIKNSTRISKLSIDFSDRSTIHLRMSDYENSEFGILGPDYYSNIVTNGRKKPVVFTDSTKIPSHFLKELNPELVITPEDLNSEETFALMSKSQKLITANSTFSWWAGFLVLQNHGQVTIPEPWAKRSQYTAHLEYPGMHTAQAVFV